MENNEKYIKKYQWYSPLIQNKNIIVICKYVGCENHFYIRGVLFSELKKFLEKYGSVEYGVNINFEELILTPFQGGEENKIYFS